MLSNRQPGPSSELPYPELCRYVFIADIIWAIISAGIHFYMWQQPGLNAARTITLGLGMMMIAGRMAADVTMLCRIRIGLVLGIVTVCLDAFGILSGFVVVGSDVLHPFVLLFVLIRIGMVILYTFALKDLHRFFTRPDPMAGYGSREGASKPRRKKLGRVRVSSQRLRGGSVRDASGHSESSKGGRNRVIPAAPKTRAYVLVSTALATIAVAAFALQVLRDEGLAAAAVLALIIGVIFFVVVFAYLIPFGVAAHRPATLWWLIGIVNLLTGWTIIGWIVCLVWAMQGPRKMQSDESAER